jgi:hypothetical protein
MNNNSPLKWLIPAIILLTLIATLAGLLPGEGQPFALTNFRGEEVTINARGLYYWDTVSSAAQMQANDLATLALGAPLLAISFWLTLRGSLRGRLLMTGTLGFILYTYITMCFGAAYNKFFLVYVALFSLSLFAFIVSMMSFDLKNLPSHFSEKLPRGWDRWTAFLRRRVSLAGMVGTHRCDLCAERHPRAGKYNQPVHPGNGSGTHCPALCDVGHSAPAPRCLGLSAGIGGIDEIPDDGRCRQRDEPQHASCRRSDQHDGSHDISNHCHCQHNHGGVIAQKHQGVKMNNKSFSTSFWDCSSAPRSACFSRQSPSTT